MSASAAVTGDPPQDAGKPAAPQQQRSFISSMYRAAGAASGLVEGYVLLCRTIASEIGKGLGSQGEGGEGAQEEQSKEPVVCEAELQQRIMQRIASVPRVMSAADLAAEISADPTLQAAIPPGTQVELQFVNENGELVEATQLNGLYTIANGDAEGYGNAAQALEMRPLRAIERTNSQGVVVRGSGAWWQSQEDEIWTAGVGPIRHRRPATARLYLSKFLMRRV